jgi:hypothetical protein
MGEGLQMTYSKMRAKTRGSDLFQCAMLTCAKSVVSRGVQQSDASHAVVDPKNRVGRRNEAGSWTSRQIYDVGAGSSVFGASVVVGSEGATASSVLASVPSAAAAGAAGASLGASPAGAAEPSAAPSLPSELVQRVRLSRSSCMMSVLSR